MSSRKITRITETWEDIKNTMTATQIAITTNSNIGGGIVEGSLVSHNNGAEFDRFNIYAIQTHWDGISFTRADNIFGSLDVKSIDLNKTDFESSYKEGRIYWSESKQCPVVWGGDNNSLQELGKGNQTYVSNQSGDTIITGKCVFIDSLSTEPTIKLASNDKFDSNKKIGLVFRDIANGGFGWVISDGILSNIPALTGVSSGDQVYLGLDGDLTLTQPEYGKRIVRIGYARTTTSISIDIKVFDQADTVRDNCVFEEFLADYDTTTNPPSVSIVHPNGTPTGELHYLCNGVYGTLIDQNGAISAQLTVGTDEAPFKNYVFITDANGIGTLATSSAKPTFPHVPIAEVLCQSQTGIHPQTGIGGFLNCNVQRTYEYSKGQGLAARLIMQMSMIAPIFISGLRLTVNATSITMTEGKVFKNGQYLEIPAFQTGIPSDSTTNLQKSPVVVANGDTSAVSNKPYSYINGYNDLKDTAHGFSLFSSYSSNYGQFVFFLQIQDAVYNNTGKSNVRLFVNLPEQASTSYPDGRGNRDGLANYLVPSDLVGQTLPLSNVLLKYETDLSTINNAWDYSLLGHKENEFVKPIDYEFGPDYSKFFISANDKLISFNGQDIDGNQEYKLPNRTGTLALEDSTNIGISNINLDGLSTYQVDPNNGAHQVLQVTGNLELDVWSKLAGGDSVDIVIDSQASNLSITIFNVFTYLSDSDTWPHVLTSSGSVLVIRALKSYGNITLVSKTFIKD